MLSEKSLVHFLYSEFLNAPAAVKHASTPLAILRCLERGLAAAPEDSPMCQVTETHNSLISRFLRKSCELCCTYLRKILEKLWKWSFSLRDALRKYWPLGVFTLG
jgi:hypothetical protein